nr:restriction endonuclease subunit S [uncultured Carboxylicivirga sp.]
MGNLKSIPEIRFPEFKTEWEHKPLNHYLKESKALNIDLKYDKTQVLSVSGESGCVNQIEHLGRSYAGESVHNYGVVENGDIVYTKSPLKANPFGIVRLNTGKAGIVSTLYAVYKVKEKNATGEFIDYYFSLDANTNRYLRPLVRKGAKNDMKINNAYVLHDKIFVPSIDEQKRITSFLAVTDKRLAQLKEKKALLEHYKKGMTQKLFSQELRFKDDKGNDFPDWEITNIESVAKVTSGGTPSRTNSTYWNGSIPWVSTTLVDFNTINDAEEYITEAGLKNSSAKLFPKGTLLMAMYGQGKTRGKLAILGIEASTNQACAAIIPNLNIVNQEYLFHNLSNRYKEIRNISNTGGQENLSAGLIKSIIIPLPSIAEQSKIVDFLIKLDEKIMVCQSKIEETKEYKKSLLQKMFCV